MTESDSANLSLATTERELAIGSIFAERFEILGKLGQGGMSAVYKARHLQMQRVVALKVLHPWLLNQATSRQRFQREGQSMCALNHPNVVKVLSCGVEGGDFFIAMDYLEGTNLAEHVRENGMMPWEEAVSIIVDCAKGLAHAHANGIVHRDIKPSNIMLLPRDGGRLVQIVDFGLAKGFDEDAAGAQKLTQTDHVLGTPYYMSPEQCSREKLDNRSDIYSLGCVLYELLAGKVPYEGESMFAIMYGHLHDDVPPLPATVPAWLQSVVRSMMARERSLRLQTMDEVIESLVSQNAPVTLEVAVKKKKERHGRLPMPVLLVLCAAFSVILGGVAWFTTRPHPTESNQSAEATDTAVGGSVDEVQKILDAAATQRERWHELNRNVTAISGGYEKDGERAIKLYGMAADLARKNGQNARAAKIEFDGGMKMGLDGIDLAVRSIDHCIQDSDMALADPRTESRAEDLLREGKNRFDILNTKFGVEYQDHDRLQLALSKRFAERERLPTEKARQIKLWMESARRMPNATLDLAGALIADSQLPATRPSQIKKDLDEARSLLIKFQPTKANSDTYATLCHQAALGSFSFAWADSVKLGEYAVSQSNRIHGPNSLESIPGNLVLASLFLNHGEVQKADKIYLRLIPVMEAHEARTTGGVYQEWRMQMAVALAAQRHFAESMKLLKHVKHAIADSPKDSPLHIQLMRSEAGYYSALGRDDDLRSVLGRARELALKYKVVSPETAWINHDLSVVLQRQGDVARALEAEVTAELYLQYLRGKDDVTVGQFRARRQTLEQLLAQQNAH